ncbi:alpha/beta hydrolase [Celerinatantimonas sp. MCCC 1A17872]|uniref:alpha/beta hydrolase n=1 Tax=Celerinatantimonas sp. MCCC 1A17872 TaxID=3177514 RepID=UPI0038C1E420
MSVFPEVTIPNTEVHILRSSNMEQEYKLFVSLPPGYHDSNDSYPVLYVTDANWVFSIFASPVFRWLPIAPMILVGIGYPTDDDDDISRLRSRDFLPTHDEKREKLIKEQSQMIIEPGKGRHFLTFIRDELFSFINTQYRTKPDNRTLFGFSWGGTFGLYTLFNQPDTFQRYIVGAPDLSWDNQVCFSYESNYADNHADLPVKLYLAVGSLDEDLIEYNCSLLVKFHAQMQSRNYQGLDMKFDLFEGETHISAIAPTASRGLRAVFD